MPQGDPRPGERYLHFKNKLYQIIAIAHHSETDERMVVYQALYGEFKTCVRPYDMFISEVDHEKYPQIRQKYRFQLVAESGMSQAGWEEKEQKQEKEQKREQEEVNPLFMEFLDSETYGDKFRVLMQMQDQITDSMITNMAVSIDVVIPEGNVDSRYQELLTCVRTKMRYEVGRLR